MEFFEKRGYKYTIIFLFASGIIARLFFYIQNQSLWFDEAGLAINFITKSYKSLLDGLDYLQAAPAGFCILEKLLLDIFKPQNDAARDLILRFIPLLSGILTLPAFYYLAKEVIRDKAKIVFAFSILALNTHAVLYCSQCKQYSTELFVSVILLIVFYKLIKGKFKWIYTAIMAAAPWFSYSSFFILAAGFAALIFKNKKQLLINIIPVLISILIYYFLSLKSVFFTNYTGMDEVWIRLQAFMDIKHPLRIIIRLGELINLTKLFAITAGLIMLYSAIRFWFTKKEISIKLLLTLPVLFVILASFLHKYPLYSRLIVFLLPIFAIVISENLGKVSIYIKSLLFIIILIAFFNPSIYAGEMAYSYARDVVAYLQEEIKPEDSIIMDNDATEYYFYLEGKGINNKIFKMTTTCMKGNAEVCNKFIQKLPDGNYYFLSSHQDFIEAIRNYKQYNLPFKPVYTKAIYFKKG